MVALLEYKSYSASTRVTGPTGLTVTNLQQTLGDCTPQGTGALATLSLPNLVVVGGIFSPKIFWTGTSLTAPRLRYVGSTFSPSSLDSATCAMDFPCLECVGGTMTFTSYAGPSINLSALISVGIDLILPTGHQTVTLDLNCLQWVGRDYTPGGNSATSLLQTKLAYIGGAMWPNEFNALTVWSMPALTYMGGACTFLGLYPLITVSFPAMVTWNSTIKMDAAQGNIVNVTLGTIGTLKKIAGASVKCAANKLSVASVNALLALLVSLDGTNGTTLWGTGKSLTTNGGTNAAPTGQGITDKATLVGRGATITTN